MADTRSEVNILVDGVIAVRGKTNIVAAVGVGGILGLQSESCVVARNIVARGAVEARCLNLRSRVYCVAAGLGAGPCEGRACKRRQRVTQGLVSPLHLERLGRS